MTWRWPRKAERSRYPPEPRHPDRIDPMVGAINARKADVETGLVLKELHVPPAFQRQIVGLAAVGITEGTGEGPAF